MSEPDGPSGGLSIGQMLLMGLGALLLLPGACSLFFIATLISEKPSSPFHDPYVQVFIPLWIVCLVASAGGIAIIVAVRRAARRPE